MKWTSDEKVDFYLLTWSSPLPFLKSYSTCICIISGKNCFTGDKLQEYLYTKEYSTTLGALATFTLLHKV